MPSPTFAESDRLARYYPEAADTALAESGPKRVRKANAVLLFAAANLSEQYPVDGMGPLRRLTFLPVLCTIEGKLAGGEACGKLMPSDARVRTTRGTTLRVGRSSVAFRQETGDGPVTLPPPYAPECCNYKGCMGRTIPYRVVESDPSAVTVSTRSVVAVWPEDADIDLAPRDPDVDATSLRDAPPPLDVLRAGVRIHQAFELGTRRYVSAGPRLLFDDGDGWRRAKQLESPGARRHHIIATTDIDADRRPELLVYVEYANNFGLHVLATNAVDAPVYGFSCGNI